MRLFLAIVVCKALRFIGGLIGKGSSLPGQFALKVCPDVLGRVELPERVIAVTGSNGKTSTVELLARILEQNGMTVAYNREGSNQIEGVTTFLLCAATLGGRVKADVVLLESDERFARHTFQHLTPTHYVILNLYRDQLTRNGHPQWMYDIVKESVKPGVHLLLNADDPMVARYGLHHDGPVTWFGVDRQPDDGDFNSGAYRDGAYCPECLSPMTYDFYHFNHIGAYRCAHCGHHRPAPDYAVSALNLAGQTMTVNGQALELALPSYYHAYNVLAAFALCRELGLSPQDIARALAGYSLHSGRVVRFTLGGHAGTLLTSKHENSISYDQSIRAATQSGEDCTVLVIVDAVSRKYFTSETSWLWDIEFEGLAAPCVKEIVLAGRYCHDLAVRFAATDIDPAKVTVEEDIAAAAEHLKASSQGYIYVITCFSDKDKILSHVEVTA